MAIRVISSVIGLPILIFFVVMGGAFLEFAVTVLALIGMYEIYMAVSKKIKSVHIVGFAAMIIYAVFMHFGLVQYIYPVAMLGIIMIMLTLVFFHTKVNVHDAAVTVFGFCYVGLLLYNVVYLRELPMGNVYVWMPFICAFGSDTGAYFVGVNFGKHKLTPVLSPKKSVEGSVGGVLSGALLCGIYFVAADKLGYIDRDLSGIVAFMVLGGVASGFSQLGDLAASSIKRFTGIKDYGKIMPGHGGVLDRFDSVLFTVPVIYLLVKYIIL